MSKYIAFIILILAFAGCETMGSAEYVVNNSTAFRIKIEGFDRISTPYDSDISKETIDIDPYGSYSVFKATGFHGEDPGIFKSIQVDSAHIIFDEKKIIVQSCGEASLRDCYDLERNILGLESDEYVKEKVGRRNGNNEYRYTYTITEEDYNNAVFIEE